MATRQEYEEAITAVKSGKATENQHTLVDRMAQEAGGGQPERAREAQKAVAKRGRQARSWF